MKRVFFAPAILPRLASRTLLASGRREDREVGPEWEPPQRAPVRLQEERRAVAPSPQEDESVRDGHRAGVRVEESRLVVWDGVRRRERHEEELGAARVRRRSGP